MINNLYKFRLIGLILPFLSNFLITLNIYNGDLLGIDENLEYSLWFLIPILCNYIYDINYYYQYSLNSKFYILHSCYIIWYLGIIVNIYWYYWSPFKIKDSIRHRTEYYDTRCLLCSLLYQHILMTLYTVQLS